MIAWLTQPTEWKYHQAALNQQLAIFADRQRSLFFLHVRAALLAQGKEPFSGPFVREHIVEMLLRYSEHESSTTPGGGAGGGQKLQTHRRITDVLASPRGLEAEEVCLTIETVSQTNAVTPFAITEWLCLVVEEVAQFIVSGSLSSRHGKDCTKS